MIALDEFPMGVVCCDASGIIQYINLYAANCIDRNREDAVGQPWQDMFPTLDPGFELPKDNMVSSTHLTLKEEGYILVATPGIPEKQSGTLFTLLKAKSLDQVTQQLDAYKNLHADMKAIFDISYDVIYVSDGKGTTLRVSSACETLWGYKEKDLVGRSVYELEREGVFKPSVTRMVLEDKRKISFVQTTKTGRRLMVIGTPIKDADGNIIRVVNASRDITEIDQLRSELEETKQLIEGYKEEIMSLRKLDEAEKKIVYRSNAMRNIMILGQKVANVDSTVLLLGESGVGKKVIASQIHRWSRRKHQPFITLNCGSIPEKMLEVELFGEGHGPVAPHSTDSQIGLFQKARGGTLYLDEITEMPLSIQIKLVGILQESKHLDARTGRDGVRIIASSNRNLEREVQAGRFREDLYYRLNVIPIHVPPLRERKEDILPLVLHYVSFFNQKYGMEKQLAADVMERLQQYSWPGNIRELHNVMERLVVTVDEQIVGERHMPDQIRMNGSGTNGIEVHKLMPLKEALESVERDLLKLAKEKYDSTTRMADALGVNQSTISRKLQQYKI